MTTNLPPTLSTITQRYPRLAAALRACCNLTEGEAATALYSVAKADPNIGSEAVFHYGGGAVCVRNAYRHRRSLRRFSGAAIWSAWHGEPAGQPANAPTWAQRCAQMRAKAIELAGDAHYLNVDLAFDVQIIESMAPDSHRYLWFVRSNGTQLVNLSLPRAKSTVEQTYSMPSWVAIFLVDLHRGLVQVTPSQALDLARNADPFHAVNGTVVAPKQLGARALADFVVTNVDGAICVHDVTIKLPGASWAIDQMSAPTFGAGVLEVIELAILDSLIAKNQSLFTRIEAVRYEIAPGIYLTSDQARTFWFGAPGTLFPRLHCTMPANSPEMALESSWLPVPAPLDAAAVAKWTQMFKEHVRAVRGHLRGVRFLTAVPTPIA